jgi:glycosyltransferase involved in cell wall biosynthesis
VNVLLANSTCKVGGVSTFMLSLRAALQAKGHRCELFFFERGPMEAHLPRDGGVHFGTLAELMRLVSRDAVAVVHANNVDWPTGISAVRRLGAKLVITAHKVREPAWTYGWHAGNCDAFVAVSSWIRDSLQPMTDAAIQVVHNGIDTRRFSVVAGTSTDSPIVAWVGRGSAARKRLEAFAAIAPGLRCANLRVWVIDQQGRDDFARVHPEASRALGAAAERWEGASFEEMPGIYRQIAWSGGCVVSTAAMEGLPLALLEAQACGCQVIAADVRGVNECVSPEHGCVLFPFEAPPQAVTRLIVDTLRDRLANRRRQASYAEFVRETFSLERMADRYLVTYARAPIPPLQGRAWQRRRHSPLLHWPAYLEERLGVGHLQYEASRELAASGEVDTAGAAARESFATAPTMYVRPSRLAHLFRFARRRPSSVQEGAAPNG